MTRRYFWAAGQGGVYPVDQAAGIEGSRVSPGAREILCRLALKENFAATARDARRIGNVPVSKERVRQIVEQEGQAVTQMREQGRLPAAWTQADAKLPGTDKTRVYAGIDGVMAPMVTQREKAKRRKAHVARRRARGKAGIGNTRPLAPAKAGDAERYHEMKIGVFYDQDKSHRHMFATAQRHKGFTRLLAIFARQVDFAHADEALTLTDGAKWILGAICTVLAFIKVMLLDFYHMSQHVHEAAKASLGETPLALAWAQQRLEEFKHQGVKPVLAAIDALYQQVRSPPKRKALRKLRNYLEERLEMLDYKTALEEKRDIGSGPTEAECKTGTLRLKHAGMKWDSDHAQAMMNLYALYDSDQDRAYWQRMAA